MLCTVAVCITHGFRVGEGQAELHAPGEAAVRRHLQGMVARIALVDLLRNAIVTGVRPEVVVVQRRVCLGILILRQELGAVRHGVGIEHLAEVASRSCRH